MKGKQNNIKGLWSKVYLFLLWGYSLFSRSFAYIGIPSMKLFIGEVSLAIFLLTRPRERIGILFKWILSYKYYFFLSFSLFCLFLYGIFSWARGVLLGYDFIVALQNLVFNIYPLYILFGYWVGQKYPQLLSVGILNFAWLNVIYGFLYMFWLGQLDTTLPWAPEVFMFGQPTMSVVAILGLLTFGKATIGNLILISLNFLIMLGIQVRGEWMAFVVAISVWIIIYLKKVKKLLLAISGFLLIGSLLYLLNIKIPAPVTRGGEISIHNIVARFIAPFDPMLAAQIIGEEAFGFAGTILEWRIPWWRSIWEEVHQSFTTSVFGFGYGYYLWSLYEIIPEGVRTPHNVFFYALGYGGWIGVLVFFAFYFALGYSLYKIYKRFLNKEALFAFSMWAGLSSSAFFGNFFETPFGAIPYYLIAGYGLAMGRTQQSKI